MKKNFVVTYQNVPAWHSMYVLYSISYLGLKSKGGAWEVLEKSAINKGILPEPRSKPVH
jgi:hypothetical protein